MKNKIKLIRCISVVTCMCLPQTNVYAQSINQEEKTYELLEQQIESEHIDIIAKFRENKKRVHGFYSKYN